MRDGTNMCTGLNTTLTDLDIKSTGAIVIDDEAYVDISESTNSSS